MTQFWVGVVSGAHVQRGVAGGFAQVCHGKAHELRRMRPGDGFIYYSPRTEMMKAGRVLQQFTAIGYVTSAAPYQVQMTPAFRPFRVNVAYIPSTPAHIQRLKSHLEWTSATKSWGLVLRRGHFKISEADFLRIAAAMGARLDEKKLEKEARTPELQGSQ
ncbi:hypothetical protein SDRG_10001 [Saprolegnia diclina VS20]|uniref:EVE domain-containing protein n=1 Tax=Saprolegnia diclina (strain VS20) TaxID=1156394 RepID=T0RQB7_SAPDV|nr:hypothetical protein SDRG_10001 [Saprolegnia diclina VS20]EQC32252.1 hypothetical protein SDRG_10001 [Saprolegnia diclina VS20]|eukprot:XP_008614193.1 hypothetical protein SDRG_10001 [Saprolegnia diclina VS20]